MDAHNFSPNYVYSELFRHSLMCIVVMQKICILNLRIIMTQSRNEKLRNFLQIIFSFTSMSSNNQKLFFLDKISNHFNYYLLETFQYYFRIKLI